MMLEMLDGQWSEDDDRMVLGMMVLGVGCWLWVDLVVVLMVLDHHWIISPPLWLSERECMGGSLLVGRSCSLPSHTLNLISLSLFP